MNLKSSKRLMLVYATIVAWLGLGVMGTYHAVTYPNLAVYFLALTGFVASYIWGESVRPATCTSILKNGKNSSREVLIYICVLIWAGAGVFGILKKADLAELAAYYSALTPFVGSYIIGVSYKPTAVAEQPAVAPPIA